jgi:hypothetical protein
MDRFEIRGYPLFMPVFFVRFCQEKPRQCGRLTKYGHPFARATEQRARLSHVKVRLFEKRSIFLSAHITGNKSPRNGMFIERVEKVTHRQVESFYERVHGRIPFQYQAARAERS